MILLNSENINFTLLPSKRKQIGPAFTTQAVRAMTPIFFQKAEELRDRWDALIYQSHSSNFSISKHSLSSSPLTPSPSSGDLPGSTQDPCSLVVDVTHWMARATFDVIGLAGFDYHFHSLHDESEEMYLAYRRMFDVLDKGPGLKGLLTLYFPLIETLWVSSVPFDWNTVSWGQNRTFHFIAGRRIKDNSRESTHHSKSGEKARHKQKGSHSRRKI